MVLWQYFPKSKQAIDILQDVVKCFSEAESKISSKTHTYHSNEVLERIRAPLESIGFKVETGKRKKDKISIPVLFGLKGKPKKSFDVDAFHKESKIVLEVEAGRAVINNQFLKDFFEACVMYDVDYLILALRKTYNKKQDFETVLNFFDTLYASGRMSLPLKGILVIGY